MLVLVLVLNAVLEEISGRLAEHAKQIAIERHGCRSVKCFRLEWAFER